MSEQNMVELAKSREIMWLLTVPFLQKAAFIVVSMAPFFTPAFSEIKTFYFVFRSSYDKSTVLHVHFSVSFSSSKSQHQLNRKFKGAKVPMKTQGLGFQVLV